MGLLAPQDHGHTSILEPAESPVEGDGAPLLAHVGWRCIKCTAGLPIVHSPLGMKYWSKSRHRREIRRGQWLTKIVPDGLNLARRD